MIPKEARVNVSKWPESATPLRSDATKTNSDYKNVKIGLTCEVYLLDPIDSCEYVHYLEIRLENTSDTPFQVPKTFVPSLFTIRLASSTRGCLDPIAQITPTTICGNLAGPQVTISPGLALIYNQQLNQLFKLTENDVYRVTCGFTLECHERKLNFLTDEQSFDFLVGPFEPIVVPKSRSIFARLFQSTTKTPASSPRLFEFIRLVTLKII